MINFVQRINDTAKIAVTGLVNNGHMLHDTAAEHILTSQAAAIKAAEVLNIPLRYTMLRRDIYNAIGDKIVSDDVMLFDKLAMREVWQ